MEAAQAQLRIGDLARRVGKTARAVRLYEDLGLLGPATRTDGGHRVYSEDAFTRLAWIDRLQRLGMSLQDIRDFIDSLDDARAPSAMARVRGMFEHKLATVREELESLQRIEAELLDGIQYLSVCNSCSSTHEAQGCASCGTPREVEAPLLITGLYKSRKNLQ